MVRVCAHFGLLILTYTSVNFLRKAAPGTTDECWKWHCAGENAQKINRNPARHTTAGILWRHRDITPGHANKCSHWYHQQKCLHKITKSQSTCTPYPSPITCWLASRARRARASQMTMYWFTWRVSLSPRHRCVHCVMTSLATTVM